MYKKRVLFISVHPAQYRDPVLELINQYHDIELQVLTLHQVAETHKEWLIKNHFNFDNKFANNGFRLPVLGEINFDIIREIRTFKPDIVVIPGHYPASCMIAILYTLGKRIPYVYMGDTVNLREECKKDKNKKSLYRLFLQYIIKKADAIWTTGKAGKCFFESQGVDESKIFQGLYTLNVNIIKHFYSEQVSAVMRDKVRQNLEIEDKEMVFLFVGKLIPSRNVMNFVKALEIVHNTICLGRAIIIGDGPDTGKLKNYIKQNNLEYIKHLEAVSYEELPDYYNAADIYVHPGSEPYSLALVEAVIAKKKVITTDEVGAAYDYVKDGHNGYIIKNHSINSIVESILKLFKCPTDLKGTEEMYQYAVNSRDVRWATDQLYSAITFLEKESAK